jgi:hypothetical protein
MTILIFKKLLLIRMVPRSCFGVFRTFKTSSSFPFLLLSNSPKSFGVKEKNATSDPETSPDNKRRISNANAGRIRPKLKTDSKS